MSRDIGPEGYTVTSVRTMTMPTGPGRGSTEPHVVRCRSISRRVVAAIIVLLLALSAPSLISISLSFAASPSPGNGGQAAEATVADQSELLTDPLPAQEQQALQIATQNGDRDFLMVDKPRGKIAFFQNGGLVFSAAALTGETKADRLPPGTFSKRFSQLGSEDDKVTPAGRFTVSRDYDSEYGTLFDINEIRGRDWTISIHQVYLGTPSERRADRLQSPDHGDKHITHGCINVTRETIRLLMDKLPKKRATVLYVLPHDQSKTAEYLAKRG
jgi:hypothetical protein